MVDCLGALELHRTAASSSGVAYTLDSVGNAHRVLGEHAQAAARYREAIAIWQEIGDRRNEADALTHLGEVHWDAGDPTAAHTAWQGALDILDDLGDTQADRLREMIADFTYRV